MSTAGEIINKSTRNNWKDDCFEVNDKTYTQVLVFLECHQCVLLRIHIHSMFMICVALGQGVF